MEYLTNFIRPELLILAPVLYLIGMGLKRSARVSDNNIPLVLGTVGIALAVVYVLATSELIGWRDILLAAFTAVTQGILTAGCSVYVNQLIKQGSGGKEG